MIESNVNSRNFFNRRIIGLSNVKNIPKNNKLFFGIMPWSQRELSRTILERFIFVIDYFPFMIKKITVNQ